MALETSPCHKTPLVTFSDADGGVHDVLWTSDLHGPERSGDFEPMSWVHLLPTQTVGFEPTCRLPDNRISSAARYDHFDTSAKHAYYTTICSFLV